MHSSASPCSAVVALLFAWPWSIALAQSASAPPAESLSAAQARADFDQLRAALEEAHGGLYRHSAKPALDSAFTALRAGLSGDGLIARRELVVVLSEMIARIGDGHARLELGR